MQHELDHLEGNLYIDYLESFDDLIPVSQLEEEVEESGEEMPALGLIAPRRHHRSAPSSSAAARSRCRPCGACCQSDLVEIESVVTAPPRPAGRKGLLRPTPVAEQAAEHELTVRTPRTLRDAAAQAELRAAGAGLIVLADYGRIIPAAVLDMPRHGALNIHPSLLPRHRGAAPVAATILAGDSVGGVTVMRMDEGLDTGPTVAQREVTLDGSEVAPELEARLARWALSCSSRCCQAGSTAGSRPCRSPRRERPSRSLLRRERRPARPSTLRRPSWSARCAPTSPGRARSSSTTARA